MRLYLFRSTPDIPMEEVEKVAERVGQAFDIDYSAFTGALSRPVEQTSIEDLLLISDRFLERGEPIAAIVFTREGIQDDEAILGQGSHLDRCAWVKWNDRIHQITIAALHELGHLCELDHCPDERCIMFPVYREYAGSTMRELFCPKCQALIGSSWVYNRLRQAAENRRKRGQRLPKTVNSTPIQLPSRLGVDVQTERGTLSTDPVSADHLAPRFPDWSLAERDREKFVRKVIEHFRYTRDEQ